MPPCGCRSGCQHRDHPDQPAQRTCRAGIVPNAVPTPGRVVQLEQAVEALEAVRDRCCAVAGSPKARTGQEFALEVLEIIGRPVDP